MRHEIPYDPDLDPDDYSGCLQGCLMVLAVLGAGAVGAFLGLVLIAKILS